MIKYKNLLDPMRLPFLILTPACILLGLATAVWTNGQINWIHFVLVMIGGLAAHLSVNILNEYFDFRSGLDIKTTRTPFSGGSGRLPENPELEKPVRMMAWLFLTITGVIGIFFSIRIGWGILPIGVLGIMIIYFYTDWLTRSPFVCLVVPGLGFGPLMVMGTDYALTGSFSWAAFIASLVPFFLVNNLLLLNQFPDVEADRSIGRNHFPIKIGKVKSSIIYLVFLYMPFVAVGFGVAVGYFPLSSLIGYIGLVIAVLITRGILNHAEEDEKLIPVLGLNVILNLVTPVLVAVGIYIGLS